MRWIGQCLSSQRYSLLMGSAWVDDRVRKAFGYYNETAAGVWAHLSLGIAPEFYHVASLLRGTKCIQGTAVLCERENQRREELQRIRTSTNRS